MEVATFPNGFNPKARLAFYDDRGSLCSPEGASATAAKIYLCDIPREKTYIKKVRLGKTIDGATMYIDEGALPGTTIDITSNYDGNDLELATLKPLSRVDSSWGDRMRSDFSDFRVFVFRERKMLGGLLCVKHNMSLKFDVLLREAGQQIGGPV